MIKLYGMTLSAHTRKVQSALIELGLAYELVVIDLNKGEQHNPDYVALNPGAKTPTLVDGDLVVIESNAILLYLADTYGRGTVSYTHLDVYKRQASPPGAPDTKSGPRARPRSGPRRARR